MWNNAGRCNSALLAHSLITQNMLCNNAGRFKINRKAPVITEPVASAIPPLLDLCQYPKPSVFEITRRQKEFGKIRQKKNKKTEAVATDTTTDAVPLPQPPVRARNGAHAPRQIHVLQRMRAKYVNKIFASAPPMVWRMFSSVRRESRVCQDRVMSAAGKMVGPTFTVRTRRKIDALILQAGGFRCRVMSSVMINVIGMQCEFFFLDPVYAWAMAAKKMSEKEPLFFDFEPRFNNLGQRLYGTSVACGEVMRLACERVNAKKIWHAGTKRGPALFGISWDGGNASKRRAYTPILISVGNSDSASPDTCVCVGYLPELPTFIKDNDVRRVVVQKCIGEIIKVVNASADNGFTCTLHNDKWVHFLKLIVQTTVSNHCL